MRRRPALIAGRGKHPACAFLFSVMRLRIACQATRGPCSQQASRAITPFDDLIVCPKILGQQCKEKARAEFAIPALIAFKMRLSL